jgi:hypothetical protein
MLREADELLNRNNGKKRLMLPQKYGIYKAFKATGELSTVLVQGGMLL